MEIDEFKRRFGARVQTLRRQRGMTQEQLAEAIGKSTDTVSNIETGRLSTRIDTALRIAQSLGVEIPRLFDVDNSGGVKEIVYSSEIDGLRELLASLPAEVAEKLIDINKKIIDIAIRLQK